MITIAITAITARAIVADLYASHSQFDGDEGDRPTSCVHRQFYTVQVIIQLNSNLHRVQEKGTILFLPLNLPNTNRFHNSFTDRLSSKFLVNQ